MNMTVPYLPTTLWHSNYPPFCTCLILHKITSPPIFILSASSIRPLWLMCYNECNIPYVNLHFTILKIKQWNVRVIKQLFSVFGPSVMINQRYMVSVTTEWRIVTVSEVSTWCDTESHRTVLSANQLWWWCASASLSWRQCSHVAAECHTKSICKMKCLPLNSAAAVDSDLTAAPTITPCSHDSDSSTSGTPASKHQTRQQCKCRVSTAVYNNKFSSCFEFVHTVRNDDASCNCNLWYVQHWQLFL